MSKTIDRNLFPKTDEIFSWIEDLTQWGHRKTGTPEGRKSAEYIAEKMTTFGLEDVKIEVAPSMCMVVEDGYSLEIEGEQKECFYINATNHGESPLTEGTWSIGEDGREQSFIYLGEGLEEDYQGVDVAGKVVVCDIRFPGGGPMDLYAWNDRAEIFDPDGQITDDVRKPDIYSPGSWPANYFYAVQGGAAGFVGILHDYFDDPYFYCEDYTEIGQSMGIPSMSIPGMWISRTTGTALTAGKQIGDLFPGKMQMRTTYQYMDALNVSGRLPSRSDDIILIHSHHDAVFDGAVQDASGIAEMLACARYFSRLPAGERDKTMMFAATDTHYTDYMGHQAFIKARQEAGDHLLLDISLEHIGEEVAENEAGEYVRTGEVETRFCYVTDSSGMCDYVREALRNYDLRKTILFPVSGKSTQEDGHYEFRQDEIITDAYYFNENDIPVISYISGPMYLFHPSDRVNRVPKDQLVPVAMAFADIATEAAKRL